MNDGLLIIAIRSLMMFRAAAQALRRSSDDDEPCTLDGGVWTGGRCVPSQFPSHTPQVGTGRDRTSMKPHLRKRFGRTLANPEPCCL